MLSVAALVTILVNSSSKHGNINVSEPQCVNVSEPQWNRHLAWPRRVQGYRNTHANPEMPLLLISVNI